MRKTKYKPEYCKRLIDEMRTGISFEAFAGVIEVSKKTLYNWMEQFPDFEHAYEIGKSVGRLFWDRYSINPGPNFSNTVYVFTMKNRFGWRDRNELEVSGRDGGAIEVGPPKSAKELKDTVRRFVNSPRGKALCLVAKK